jgi:hypothetical protein
MAKSDILKVGKKKPADHSGLFHFRIATTRKPDAAKYLYLDEVTRNIGVGAQPLA